jgi:hypothetical protein
LAMKKIPRMSGDITMRNLEAVGASWSGRGVAVECGVWFGATACALLKGLKKAKYDRSIYLFDRWIASASEVEKAAAYGVEIKQGQNFSSLTMSNVLCEYKKIEMTQGDIGTTLWKHGPIEIMVLDAAKRQPHFGKWFSTFAEYFIPGVTTLAMLDWGYFKQFKGQQRFEMEIQKRFTEHNAKSLVPIDEYNEEETPKFFLVTGTLEMPK